MKTLNVELGDRSYPIYIGRGLLANAELLKPFIKGQRVAIVSNDVVAPLYLDKVKALLQDYDPVTVILPDGEEFKDLEHLNRIFDALLEAHCDRGITMVALGGGVVGDMTGFAAACYQRGVAFIQIPTTLLAQVDSSVGGKTGVNHRLGKNMIGAFHQPQCVIIDTDSLDTLPDNELSAGLAEVIKYGLIRDAEYVTWLDQNMENLLSRDKTALSEAIFRSCEHKARIVAEDEREAGVRALLNLGHTFGHAIEAGMGYGSWLHGEAIAVGMVMAADLSRRMDWLTLTESEHIAKLISSARLPTQAPAELSVERMQELMAVDKKVQNGQLRLVLLTGIGKARVTSEFTETLLRETLKRSRATA